MITGNTVQRQHTGSTKLRSREQPDIDRQPDKIQTLRQHTNRDNIRCMERVTVHKPSDQRRYNPHRKLERTTAHKHRDQWRNNRHRSLERTTAHKHTDQWRNNRHTYKQQHKQPPIGQTTANSRGGNVEYARQKLLDCRY